MGRVRPKGTITSAVASRKYDFYALTGGLRIPMAVDGLCSCDADASLVAATLTTPLIGVEVRREGLLIYEAPCRENAYSDGVAGRA